MLIIFSIFVLILKKNFILKSKLKLTKLLIIYSIFKGQFLNRVRNLRCYCVFVNSVTKLKCHAVSTNTPLNLSFKPCFGFAQS